MIKHWVYITPEIILILHGRLKNNVILNPNLNDTKSGKDIRTQIKRFSMEKGIRSSKR